jgi:hypothetical protein
MINPEKMKPKALRIRITSKLCLSQRQSPICRNIPVDPPNCGKEVFPMTTKQLIMIGTIAILITFNSGPWKDEPNTASAAPLTLTDRTGAAEKEEAAEKHRAFPSVDALNEALGVSSDEELYDALYEGETLAGIADSRGKDVSAVIRLQTSELAKQLEERAASGSISPAVYEAQKQELYEIVARSAYGL